ncbi:MAG: zinc ribbon domain-containing protein [Candidatus Latescibacterota bacterium]|nr:MAG: zinc ribbon domain-containing protein [Candidatus Latescibacterota bacterium]
MPLYEYKCENCQGVFSELRSMSEREAPITCPDCGGEGKIIFSTFAQGGQKGPAEGFCPMPGTGNGPCAKPT